MAASNDDCTGLISSEEFHPGSLGGDTYLEPDQLTGVSTTQPLLSRHLNALGEVSAPCGEQPCARTTEKPASDQIDLGCCLVKTLPFNILTAIATTCSSIGLLVTLPIYSEYVVEAGSDLYIILVWCALWTCTINFIVNFGHIAASKAFRRGRGKSWRNMLPDVPWPLVAIVGGNGALNGILAVYASDPHRTPGYLQALLGCVIIPFTIVFRYCMLRKGVSTIRLICCFAVLVGLFIASEPEIFDLMANDETPTGGREKHSIAYRVLWPLCFAVSLIPVALTNVLIEKGCQRKDVQNLAFLSWTAFFQLIVVLLFFWTDLIQGFGLSGNLEKFRENLRVGFQCHLGLRAGCSHLTYVPWIFVIFYIATNFSSLMVTRFTDGAIYTSIVTSLATPMAALFWSVFSSNPFRYNPVFRAETGYTLAGLALMLPGTISYNFFSHQEEQLQRRNALWWDIWSEEDIYRG